MTKQHVITNILLFLIFLALLFMGFQIHSVYNQLGNFSELMSSLFSDQ